MQKLEHQPTEATPQPEKKHNLGAKIGVGLTLGSVVGGKLAIPGMVMDLNGLFPKGTPLGTKFKKTFSKEIAPIMQEALMYQMEIKGRKPLMAVLAATKWSTILSTAGFVVLGAIGWKRADRLNDSKDIIKHPIKSTKIILGLEEPEPMPSKTSEEIKGKHTAALAAERSAQAETQIQR